MENEAEQRQHMLERDYELQQHMMTGGYELRQYIEVLIKYWWLIALGTVLAAAAALVASLSMTPTYEATAGILVVGTRTQITFDPAKAARIVNVWAAEYEKFVNALYSERSESYTSVQKQAVEAGTAYEQAQAALLSFMADDDRTAELGRIIAEKQTVISEWQSAKQSATAAVIASGIDVQQQVISATLQSQARNQLLAFNKGQAAKQQVLSELMDAEVANRVAALRRDRNIRLELFNSYVDAEVKSTLAVFDRQVDEKLGDLAQAYDRKDKLERLLRDARSLRVQVAHGGSGSSNQLALTLLKAEAFASSVGLPGELQVQLSAASGESQPADVDALISALEQERSQAEEEIQTLSAALLAGEGYQFLDSLSADNLSVSMPPSGSLSLASPAASSSTEPPTSLASYIDQKYAELFDLGDLARSAAQVTGDTPLFKELEKLYPDLFQMDALMRLSETEPPLGGLGAEAQQQVAELLQLKGMESILNATEEAEPITRKIAELQAEVRELKTEQEMISGQLKELTRARDLAWDTYSTLQVKVAELGIATETKDVEVRFASPAVEPLAPTNVRTSMNVTLAAVVGLMLAIGVAFLLYYLDPEYDPATLVGAPLARFRGTQPAQQTDAQL